MQKLHVFIVKNFGEYNEENKYHVVSTPFKGIYYVEFENKYFLGLSIKMFADRTHTEQVENFKLVIDSRKVFGQNNSKNHFFVFETVIKTIQIYLPVISNVTQTLFSHPFLGIY